MTTRPEARAAVESVVARPAPPRARAARQAAGPGDSAPPRAVEALLAQEHLALADRVRVDELVRGPARGLLVREVPRFGGDV